MTRSRHDGVISAGRDNIGALAVMAAIGARHMDEAPELRLQRFGKLGNIDLRVDYLRPGIGEHFDLPAPGRVSPRLAGALRVPMMLVDGNQKEIHLPSNTIDGLGARG